MSGNEDNQEGRRGELSDEDRAPNRRDGGEDRRHRAESNALLDIRTLVEERFNQIMMSNRRTVRQLQDQESSSTPLRHIGNERQLRFNNSILAIVEDTKDFINDGQLGQADSRTNEAIAKLKERNKHIRLADRSPGGWDTVREYQDDDLADDEAD